LRDCDGMWKRKKRKESYLEKINESVKDFEHVSKHWITWGGGYGLKIWVLWGRHTKSSFDRKPFE